MRIDLRVSSFPLLLAVSLLTSCGPAEEGELLPPGEDLSTRQHALTFADRVATCQSDARVQTGLVSVDVCVGADLFFREPFGGNGRSCGTCHPARNNFTLDPAFIATLPSSDPLFIAEQDPALAGLEIPAQLRARALILENADGFEPDPTVRFVLRSVPHSLSMGTSVTRPPGDSSLPLERTGWSGDGAPRRAG